MDAVASGDNSGQTGYAGAYLSGSYVAQQPGATVSVKIFNDASTTNYRQLLFQSNGVGSTSPNFYTQAGGSLWKNATQATAIRVMMMSSSSQTTQVNINAGSCSLYGIVQ